MLTPAQVRNHQFSASGRGTYRASEVDDFFASVCSSYEQMFRENGELLKKIGLLADKVEEYKSDEDNIREALLTAQRMANKIISDAKADAEKRLSEAVMKAEQITNDAQQKADDTITSAQKTAETLLSDSRKSADEIVGDAQRKAEEKINSIKRSVTQETLVLEMTKREVSDFRASLVAMYKSHIELINKIPYIVEAETESIKETASAGEKEEQIPQPVSEEESVLIHEEDALRNAFVESEPMISQETEKSDEAETAPEEKPEDTGEGETELSDSQQGESGVAAESGFAVKFDTDDTVVDYPKGNPFEVEFDDDEDGYETISSESSDKDDYGEEPISFRNLFKKK